jgi:hypothetical protein
MSWEPIKKVEIRVLVTVDPSVPEESVFRQVTEAIDPDSWNWDMEIDLVDCMLGRRLIRDEEEE